MTRVSTVLFCLAFAFGAVAGATWTVTPAQGQSGDKMFGGLILPYSGQVRTEIAFDPTDPESEMLMSVSVKAPIDFQCSEVGWEFAVSQFNAVPSIEKAGKQEDGSVYWSQKGHTEIYILGENVCIEILGEKNLYRFVFRYDSKVMDQGTNQTRCSSDVNGFPVWTVVEPVNPSPRGDCPGGNCSCGAGLCSACCSEGYHPSCKNCRRNTETCTCYKNRQTSAEAELIEYEVVPIDPES